MSSLAFSTLMFSDGGLSDLSFFWLPSSPTFQIRPEGFPLRLHSGQRPLDILVGHRLFGAFVSVLVRG